MNRTILEKAKCMCAHAGLPRSLWAEAASTATYVYNRLPNAPLIGKSPHEVWYNRKPDLSNLRVFGCVSYALVPAAKRRKFDDRTTKMRFLGYHKGHRRYKLMEEGGTHVYYRTNVTFDEDNFRLSPDRAGSDMVIPTIKVNIGSSGSHATKPVEAPVRQPEIRKLWSRQWNRKWRLRNLHFSETASFATVWINSSLWWRKSLPLPCVPQNSRSRKPYQRPEGALTPTSGYRWHRKRWTRWLSTTLGRSPNLDVHTAFLNGKLDEDIYMCQPEGFVVKGQEGMVCHLHRSLYGHKQSLRCWNKELSCHLLKTGFQRSKADPFVYFQWKDGHFNIYVDDLILVVDLLKDLLRTKEELSSSFKMKDLGLLRYCLGIVCVQEDGCIRINQRPYIDNLVKRFRLTNAFEVSTPADACVKLVADDEVSQPADPRLFQQIVGCLQYAAGGIRPDIAYAVSTIAKFCHQPTGLHMTAAKRVPHYLKQTRDLNLRYVKNTPKAIIRYSDADWAGDVKDRRSTSRNVFLLGGGAITWSSQKQSSVALSTVEAKFMALCVATQEAIWLRQLEEELGVTESGPMLIYEDNQGAISMAKNPVCHKLD